MYIAARQEASKKRQKPILALEHVCTGYGNRTVIHDVCLHIVANEVIALLGDNGAGKSTMLKVIAGLLQVTTGKVLFKNRSITGLPPHAIQQLGIGYLLQGGRVFVNLTVRQNIEMATRRARLGKVCSQSSQNEILFPCLRDQWNMRAGLLSGGDRKMLAFQMVWTQKPLLLLLDEPMSGLATDMAAKVIQCITEFAAMRDRAVLLVEQNLEVMKSIGDRCLMLKDGMVAATELPSATGPFIKEI